MNSHKSINLHKDKDLGLVWQGIMLHTNRDSKRRFKDITLVKLTLCILNNLDNMYREQYSEYLISRSYRMWDFIPDIKFQTTYRDTNSYHMFI